MDTTGLMHGDDWLLQDVRGWIGCEKFDGFRALWTGTELITREGNSYDAPRWFTQQLPAIPLDCELFAGYGQRDTMTNIDRQTDPERWRKLRLKVFDVPGASGGYLQRLSAAVGTVKSEFADVVQVVALRSAAHAWELVSQIRSRNGEGMIAHNPRTPYRAGRTINVLKFKF